MNKTEAFELGYNEGLGQAENGDFLPGMTRDEMVEQAWEAELEVARQMAGHPTYEIEYASRSAKDEWAGDRWFNAYDEGFEKGVRAGLRKRFGKSRKRSPSVRKNPGSRRRKPVTKKRCSRAGAHLRKSKTTRSSRVLTRCKAAKRGRSRR